MKYTEIYEEFKKHFKIYAGQVKSWSPNGEGSIRLTFKDGRNYIFTCKNHELRFERMKGDGAMKC